MDFEGITNVTNVWVPDDSNGFTLCQIVDINCECLILRRLHESKTFRAYYDTIFPAEEDVTRDVDDNCSLTYLNDASVLHNCRLRYNREQFYTYVANILIVINPYKQIPGLYNASMIMRYKKQSLGTLPPHIFAIADKAYRDMRRHHESQSIIISGESGAGKTESQKHIIRFLCESWGYLVGKIEHRILQISTILESFGNAKTTRNNNSSRFGKFVEIHFNKEGSIVGGFVTHYLLERSRLCVQNLYERNFHIFYQLLAGIDDNSARKLKLDRPQSFNYLKKGCTQFFLSEKSCKQMSSKKRKWLMDNLQDELIDDYTDFQNLLKAFKSINVSIDDQNGIFELIAAILHLGNICFIDESCDYRGGCTVASQSNVHLHNAAELLGIEVNDLRKHLITRLMQPTRSGIKGTVYAVPLRLNEARLARDALAKVLYAYLFDAIVDIITKCMPFSNSACSIGVLDTAGFEAIELNSYEQLCINYCNEKLQNFFNERIFMDEQDLYCKEGLHYERIEFFDNKACIDLFEEKHRGIFDLLDNEARLPISSAAHFTLTVHKAHGSHPCLMSPHSTRHFRKMNDNEGFIICHYAADVCYNTTQFIEKNNDSLHSSLYYLMQQSRKSIICKLFDGKVSNVANQDVPRRKLVNASVASKFRSQLSALLEKLRQTRTHFVRCIKPNDEMKSGKFDGGRVLVQLKCAGMSSALKVMQNGFPSRISCKSIHQLYQYHLPRRLANLDAQLLCKCLFQMVGLSNKDYRFGLTMIFFRNGKFAELDKILQKDRVITEKLVMSISSWLSRYRFKKAQFAVVTLVKILRLLAYRAKCRIKVQNAVRSYLTRKLYQPKEDARFADLAKWQYESITAGINSADSKLSIACKAEYYRRMRAYTEWKERNMASKVSECAMKKREDEGQTSVQKLSSQFSIYGDIYLSWEDERLKWDEIEWKVDEYTLHDDHHIWKPIISEEYFSRLV
ncbi:unnamed protein product [Thelazia callipaeda]|uniref:Myosin motor domain-containing protein n=1 Tax=Thelazia callipaeda TaxID=103827 RepID=A0A0N5DB82_THECL|nr:unnamed protein product [Thelazia callipaeda]